jgi:DNA-binding NtrC family response regulator
VTQVKGTAKTVLVVDDEPQIVRIVSGFLCGEYNIIAASSGSDALHQSQLFQGEIHVLLSDFQMPGMTGIELATRVTRARPDVKVLLMSGYPEGMLELNDGWHFLAKPFSLSTLRSLLASLVHPRGSLLTTPRSSRREQMLQGPK